MTATPLVDEIVVIDSDSTDGTAAAAASGPARSCTGPGHRARARRLSGQGRGAVEVAARHPGRPAGLHRRRPDPVGTALRHRPARAAAGRCRRAAGQGVLRPGARPSGRLHLDRGRPGHRAGGPPAAEPVVAGAGGRGAAAGRGVGDPARPDGVAQRSRSGTASSSPRCSTPPPGTGWTRSPRSTSGSRAHTAPDRARPGRDGRRAARRGGQRTAGRTGGCRQVDARSSSSGTSCAGHGRWPGPSGRAQRAGRRAAGRSGAALRPATGAGRAPGPAVLRLGRHVVRRRTQRLVMAIVNRTPDSFYDRGATWDAGRGDGAGARGRGRGRRHRRHRRRAGRRPATRSTSPRRSGGPSRSSPRSARPTRTWSSASTPGGTRSAGEVCAAGADLLNDTWGGWDPQLRRGGRRVRRGPGLHARRRPAAADPPVPGATTTT